jgi:hypothetical protein
MQAIHTDAQISGYYQNETLSKMNITRAKKNRGKQKQKQNRKRKRNKIHKPTAQSRVSYCEAVAYICTSNLI